EETPLLSSPLRRVRQGNPCPAPARQNLDSPTQLDACSGCHQRETDSWLAGRHGMRLAQGLTPMRPSMARLPMKKAAAHFELSCATCHGAAQLESDTLLGLEVESCLGCHDDKHSLAYQASPHFQLLLAETQGRI